MSDRPNTATGPLKHETTKAIEKHLRILGYTRGTVEWDGALAAARAMLDRRTAQMAGGMAGVNIDIEVGVHLMPDGSLVIEPADRLAMAAVHEIGHDPSKLLELIAAVAVELHPGPNDTPAYGRRHGRS